MRQRGEGWILNITSRWAEHPAPPYPEWATQRGSIPYGIVKIGLDRLSTGLAAEARADGIRVNALSTSGLVPTPGTKLLGLTDYPLERPGATVAALFTDRIVAAAREPGAETLGFLLALVLMFAAGLLALHRLLRRREDADHGR